MSQRPFTDPAVKFWANVEMSPSCWIWRGSRGANGYGLISTHGRNSQMGAHRFAWTLFHGHVPARMFVCHICDTPACVRPDHLFLGTPADNSRDMVNKGRVARGPRTDTTNWRRGANHHWNTHPEDRLRGSKNGCAKLTEANVVTIRSEYGVGGISQQQLADRFGVSQVAISLVVRREKWRHVA